MYGGNGIHGDFKGLPFMNWCVAKHTSSAFTGDAAANRHGDIDGTNNPYSLFTVTGDVIIFRVWGIVNTTLVGSSSIEIGVTGNINALMVQVAATTDLADGDVWQGATNTPGIGEGNIIAYTFQAVNDGADIIETLNDAGGGANVTAGQIDYYCIWAPVEAGASIVPATAVA
jgi:hypothetical protein